MSLHVVILAGGIGARFWPLSSPACPKQFLDFLGTGRSLIQATFDRFVQLVPKENIWVVTHRDYLPYIEMQLPSISVSHILLESERKNTAASVAYAVYHIARLFPDATVLMTPADHFIEKQPEFIHALQKGYTFIQEAEKLSKTDELEKESLPIILTLGIDPTSPNIGYGYIQVDPLAQSYSKNGYILPILSFVEKPTLEKAQNMLSEGNYYWNAGIFIFSLRAGIQLFKQYASLFHDAFLQSNRIEEIFAHLPHISFDYALMEKIPAAQLYIIHADIGWSDLGTWSAVHTLLHKQKTRDFSSNDGINLQNQPIFLGGLPEKKNCLSRI